jgi:hypothetical protein
LSRGTDGRAVEGTDQEALRMTRHIAVLAKPQTEKLFARHIQEDSGDSFYGWSIQDSRHGNLITHAQGETSSDDVD